MNAMPPDVTGSEMVLGEWCVPRTTDMVPGTRLDIRMMTGLVVGLGPLNRDIELMAGELLTNAAQHGGGAEARVRLTTAGPTLRVEIRDAGTGPLRRRGTGVLAEHGRGLVLVAFLATDWGLERTDTGTCAWFEVQQPHERRDEAV